ncbi:hypothetical protein I317_00778 [Kwoniella heveanensis CBS 569]|nr:hypothetical protein I317_00778 [Kwoniella heveanensis CBS 569]
MTSPNPADHPLPVSPELNDSSLPTLSHADKSHGHIVPDPAHAPSKSPEQELSQAISTKTAALISSLRSSLESAQATISAQTTRLSALSDVESEYAQLKDQHAFVTAAKEAVESQLKEEVKKREVAEENVEMLRGQVEQARRGVMVLQKQEADRKRMSIMSGGSSGMMGLGLGEEQVLNNFATMGGGGESRIAKRSSIIVRSHRRQSSQSEPADIHVDKPLVSPNPQAAPPPGAANSGGNTLRPGGHGLRELRLGSTPTHATTSLPSPNISLNDAHQSGYFDEPTAIGAPAPAPQPKKPESPSKKEMEAVEEAAKLRSAIGALQVKLEESEEARMASETCLKALREFMAGSTGAESGDVKEMSASTADLLKGIRLPPLPTDRDAEEDQIEAQRAAAAADKAKLPTSTSGWGFKLWNARAAPISPSRELPPSGAALGSISPQKALSPSDGRSRAGSTATVNSKVSPSPTPGGAGEDYLSSTQTPLSSFVSNWTKGVGSAVTSPPVASPQQTVERPASSRKLSVTGFFSRGSSKKETPPANSFKDLPTPPESAEVQVENEMAMDENRIRGDASLEPSPEIGNRMPLERSSSLTGSASEDRRTSHVTTITDLESELGTPHGGDLLGQEPEGIVSVNGGKVRDSKTEGEMVAVAL